MSWNSPESLRAIHENAFEYRREVEPLKTAVVVVVHEDDDADNRRVSAIESRWKLRSPQFECTIYYPQTKCEHQGVHFVLTVKYRASFALSPTRTTQNEDEGARVLVWGGVHLAPPTSPLARQAQ